MPPDPGEQAPDFEGLYCDGETFRPRPLSAVRGNRGTVLVFGGFVGSAIATNWWQRYENADWDAFQDVPVIGVHRDGPYAINAFLRARESPFSMFADVEGSIAGAYDLLGEREGMAGIRTADRAILVIDGAGVVDHVWRTDDWISPVPRAEIEAAVADL
jgi:peroxiredoxin